MAVFATMFTAGYALWTIRRIFFGPLPKRLNDVTEAPPTVTLPMLTLAFITVLLGIYPEIVTHFLVPFAKQLVGG
ncbi:MAG: hypothetical protein ACE5Z5_00100 [Candidatus Bathyarchaeia archaeon]